MAVVENYSSGIIYTIAVCVDRKDRHAEAYLNAHTRVDWGVKFFQRRNPDRYQSEEKWQGTGYRFIDAIKICQAWAIHGEALEDKQRKMMMMLGAVDPNGYVTDGERLHAIEAAWTAGAYDLAKQLAADCAPGKARKKSA